MIQITELMSLVYDAIKAKPDATLPDVVELTGIEYYKANDRIRVLIKLGALTRSGNHGGYMYRISGKEVSVKNRYENQQAPKEDLLLNTLKESDLTDQQKEQLLNSLHLPRQELARKLGISKLELNQAMDKHRITSSYRPKDIGAEE